MFLKKQMVKYCLVYKKTAFIGKIALLPHTKNSTSATYKKKQLWLCLSKSVNDIIMICRSKERIRVLLIRKKKQNISGLSILHSELLGYMVWASNLVWATIFYCYSLSTCQLWRNIYAFRRLCS